MQGRRVYLDSSAIVKRYVEEAGSGAVEALFREAEALDSKLYFSLWNIGEVAGVFDRYRRNSAASPSSRREVFFNDMMRYVRIGAMEIADVTYQLVLQSIEILYRNHIYISDALQIATCKQLQCDEFVTSDRRLSEIAQREGLRSVLIGA